MRKNPYIPNIIDLHPHMDYLIGIDEAGRGPWAGPIVVGGFLVSADLVPDIFERTPGLTDSKKLSEEKRATLFSTIEYMQSIGECQYSFAYRDADFIDRVGIREANRQCMQDVILSFFSCLGDDESVEICIDGCDNFVFESVDLGYTFAQKRKKGSEKNPALKTSSLGELSVSGKEKRRNVRYVIGGDESIPQVSAASIVAKVLRDRMMCEFHENFPEYGFDTNKGYGTKRHQEALLNYGISPLHRKSYAPVSALISGHL